MDLRTDSSTPGGRLAPRGRRTWHSSCVKPRPVSSIRSGIPVPFFFAARLTVRGTIVGVERAKRVQTDPGESRRLSPITSNSFANGCVTEMNSTVDMLQPRASRVTPSPEWTDEELLLTYRSRGDRRAFEVLVHRYEGELYSYLRHYLGDAEMAED